MKKEGLLFIIGLFMLFFLLPFSHAIDFFLSANMTGQQGIPFVFNPQNSQESIFLSFVLVTDDPLNKSLFFLDVPSYNIHYPLSQCNLQCTTINGMQYSGTAYQCSCDLQWAPDSLLTLVLKYRNTAKSITLYPDTEKPLIQASLKQNQDHLQLTYNAHDSACVQCGSVCSGIKTLLLQDEEQTLWQKDFSDFRCTRMGVITLPYAKDGQHTFFLTAIDVFGHETTQRFTLTTDFTLPRVKDFQVKKEGRVLDFIGNNTRIDNVEISFLVQEQNLQSLSVYLSSLGPNQDLLNIDPLSFCIPVQDGYHCSFSASIDHAELTLPVLADDGNNQVLINLTKHLSIDVTPPLLRSFSTPRFFDGKYYGGNTFSVVAEVTEKEGFYDHALYLDASALGYSQLLMPENCTQENLDTWKCFWSFQPKIKKDVANLYISPLSHDDALNPLITETKLKVYADYQAPVIHNITVWGINNLGEFPYYQAGDVLRIEAWVEETMGIADAWLNVSAFFDSPTVLHGSCVQEKNALYHCSWETSPIKGGYYTAPLFLTLVDYGNNVATISKTITVFGLLDEEPDNYVLTVYQPIPKTINRLTAQLLPNPPGYKISIPFMLSTNAQTLQILHYEIEDCTLDNDTTAYENLFEDPQNPTPEPVPTFLPVTQSGVVNYAEFTMRQLTKDEAEHLKDMLLSCTINIWEKKGDYVFTKPEKEFLEIELSFTNATITGMPHEKILDKIEREKTDLLKKTKWASDAAQFMSKAEKVCQSGQSLVSLWGTMGMIEGLGLTLSKVPFVGEALFTMGCWAYEIVGGTIVMPLWYGSGFDNGFSVSRCSLKWKEKVSGYGDSTNNPVLKKSVEKITKETDKYSPYVGDNLELLKKDHWPGMRWFCGFVGCEFGTHLSENLKRYTGGGIFEGVNITHLNLGSFGYVDLRSKNIQVNPKDSLMVSVASACLPGILYNIDKWRRLKCSYIKCLQETAKQGGDINICDNLYKEGKCLAIWGEITNSFGLLALLRSLSTQTVEIAKQLLPNGLKAIIDKTICENDKLSEENRWLVTLSCDIPRAWYAFQDSLERLKSLKNAKDSFSFSFDEDNPCGDIGE